MKTQDLEATDIGVSIGAHPVLKQLPDLLSACVPCTWVLLLLPLYTGSQQLTEKKATALALFRTVKVPGSTGESQRQ